MDGLEGTLFNAHYLRELRALEDEPWAMRMDKLLRLAAGIKNSPVERIKLLYDSVTKLV